MHVYHHFFFSFHFLFISNKTNPLCRHCKDLKTNDFLYEDHYHEYLIDNSLHASVSYKKDDLLIASKEVSFDTTPSAPSFKFINHQTGVIASVNVASDVTIYYRPSFNKPYKTKTIPLTSHTVIDAGFHYYVLNHWDALDQNELIPVDYVAPSKQRTFSLQMKKIKEDIWNGKQTHVFHIESTSFIARLFIKPILLRYDSHTQQLLYFQGISNIKQHQSHPIFL